MISVQSRQQLLNGSKFLVLFASLILVSSCGLFNKSRDKDKGKDRISLQDRDVKMDTLDVERIPSEDFPPITKEVVKEEPTDKFDAFRKEEYKIGMLIPFNAEEFQYGGNAELNDYRFVNYYAGVKLALNELQNEDAKFSILTYDSERSQETVDDKLASAEFNNVDIIIGPYDRSGLRQTADFGKENKVAVISPWLASTKITDDNPFYVQLRPSLSSHYFQIIEHITRNFNEDEIVLLGRDISSDKNRFRFFQRTYTALNNNSADGLQEFLVKEDSLSYGETAYDDLFMSGGKKAVIIPNWNYNDEDFIYACLRRLNIEKGLTDVYVYGMPIMFDSEKMDFDFYRNLNMRICLSEFVDWEEEKVKLFMRKYYDTYGDLPTSDAFEGYDMMKFIGSNLLKYGINFHLYLEEDRERYLQTAYDIQKVYDSDDEKFENIKYLENKHLDLIQYVDNKFVKID